MSSGQVLLRDYSFDEALLIVKEMTDLLCLELFDKQLITEVFPFSSVPPYMMMEKTYKAVHS